MIRLINIITVVLFLLNSIAWAVPGTGVCASRDKLPALLANQSEFQSALGVVPAGVPSLRASLVEMPSTSMLAEAEFADARDMVRAELAEDENSWVVFGDFRLLFDRNQVYGYEVVNFFIREVVAAADWACRRYGGRAQHLVSDEILMVLPSRCTQPVVAEALHDVNREIFNRFNDLFIFASLDITGERETVCEHLAGRDSIVEIERLPIRTPSGIEERYFVLFEKRNSERDDEALARLQESLPAGVSGELDYGVSVPWLPMGAVRASHVPRPDGEDWLERILEDASYMQHLSKEEEDVDFVKVASREDLRRIPRIAADSAVFLPAQRVQIEGEARSAEAAIQGTGYKTEKTYPAYQRCELGKMVRDGLADRDSDVMLCRVDIAYEVMHDESHPLVCAMREASGTRPRKKEAAARRSVFGFKAINETDRYFGRKAGNDVILLINNALYKAFCGNEDFSGYDVKVVRQAPDKFYLQIAAPKGHLPNPEQMARAMDQVKQEVDRVLANVELKSVMELSVNTSTHSPAISQRGPPAAGIKIRNFIRELFTVCESRDVAVDLAGRNTDSGVLIKDCTVFAIPENNAALQRERIEIASYRRERSKWNLTDLDEGLDFYTPSADPEGGAMGKWRVVGSLQIVDGWLVGELAGVAGNAGSRVRIIRPGTDSGPGYDTVSIKADRIMDFAPEIARTVSAQLERWRRQAAKLPERPEYTRDIIRILAAIESQLAQLHVIENNAYIDGYGMRDQIFVNENIVVALLSDNEDENVMGFIGLFNEAGHSLDIAHNTLRGLGKRAMARRQAPTDEDRMLAATLPEADGMAQGLQEILFDGGIFDDGHDNYNFRFTRWRRNQSNAHKVYMEMNPDRDLRYLLLRGALHDMQGEILTAGFRVSNALSALRKSGSLEGFVARMDPNIAGVIRNGRVNDLMDLSCMRELQNEISKERPIVNEVERLLPQAVLLTDVCLEFYRVFLAQPDIYADLFPADSLELREKITNIKDALIEVAEGRLSLKRWIFNLGEESLQRQIIKYGLDVTAEFAGLVRVDVEVDGFDFDVEMNLLHLNRILKNLVKNARDFIGRAGKGDKEGSIQVRARVDGRELVIYVIDDGEGFPEFMKARVGTMGETLSDGSDSLGSGSVSGAEDDQGFVPVRGTGTGTAMVRKIAEHYGGSAGWHDNPSGPGAMATVRLPVIPGSEEAPAEPVPAAAENPGDPGTGDPAGSAAGSALSFVDPDAPVSILLEHLGVDPGNVQLTDFNEPGIVGAAGLKVCLVNEIERVNELFAEVFKDFPPAATVVRAQVLISGDKPIALLVNKANKTYCLDITEMLYKPLSRTDRGRADEYRQDIPQKYQQEQDSSFQRVSWEAAYNTGWGEYSVVKMPGVYTAESVYAHELISAVDVDEPSTPVAMEFLTEAAI